MKHTVRKFAIACGTCVVFVSLLSGCASQPMPNRVPMATVDLNHFIIDCRRKQEQVEFLQGLRQSREEQMAARLRLMFNSYELVTNPTMYQTNYDMANGNPNKYINYLLKELATC